MGRRYLTEEEVGITLAVVDAIVNSRPFTQITEDAMNTLRPIYIIKPQVKLGNTLREAEDDEHHLGQYSTQTDLWKQ